MYTKHLGTFGKIKTYVVRAFGLYMYMHHLGDGVNMTVLETAGVLVNGGPPMLMSNAVLSFINLKIGGPPVTGTPDIALFPHFHTF